MLDHKAQNFSYLYHIEHRKLHESLSVRQARIDTSFVVGKGGVLKVSPAFSPNRGVEKLW